MTKVIKGIVHTQVIGQNYRFRRVKKSLNDSKTSGHGKRLIFVVETGAERLENIIFAGTCPIEKGDEVKVIAYEKKVKIKGDSYYEAREIQKTRGGKISRIDYSAKEN